MESPNVDKAGLDVFLWCDGADVYLEAVSADAKDFCYTRFGMNSGDPIVGIAIQLEELLDMLPDHYCSGLLGDDGAVNKIIPSGLH